MTAVTACHHCRRRIPTTQSYWTIETGRRRSAVYCSRRCAQAAEAEHAQENTR